MIHKIANGSECNRTTEKKKENIMFQSSVLEVYKKEDKVRGHP